MATAKLYASFPENLGGGNTAGEGPMDILSDTLKQMLTTSTYTPGQTTHTVKADVTNEVSGTGYTAGGETLGSKTYAVSSLVTTFDCADVVWTNATITGIRNAVIYDDTPTSPADPLISYFAMDGDQSVASADFTIQINASGVFTLTVA